MRLLLVDDDAMQLELVERALGRDGFEITKASTLDEIRANTAAPEMVLVDVNMPDAPVEQVVATVRQVAPGAKVILYSAWEASRLRRVAADTGADGFVSKSESVFTLAATLKKL